MHCSRNRSYQNISIIFMLQMSHAVFTCEVTTLTSLALSCSSASRNSGRILRTASPCARHASVFPGTEDTSLLVRQRVTEPSALTASMSYPWRLCRCHRDIAALGQLFHAEVCSPVEARVANLAACVDEKLHCKSRVTLLKLSASFFGGPH